MNWTGDASTGTIPATKGQIGQAGILQGYFITTIEIVPQTPAPTNGYGLTIKDQAGVDVLDGAAAALSATAPAAFSASPALPPLNGTFTLTITGQSQAGAKGVVYIYMQDPSTLIGSGGSGTPGPPGPPGHSDLPATARLQYWRSNPDTNAIEAVALPSIAASDYNFSPQTPGGSLAAGSNTITIACPLGVNGADSSHPLRFAGGSGADFTANITGGTCTSGAASGTIIFTAPNTKSGAWTVASATAGGQEAISAAPSTGAAVYFNGEQSLTGCLSVINKPVALLGTSRASAKLTFSTGLPCAAIRIATSIGTFPDISRSEVGNLTIVNQTMNQPTLSIEAVQDAPHLAHNLYIQGGSAGIQIGAGANEIGISDFVIEDVGTVGLNVDMTTGGNHFITNGTIGTKLAAPAYAYGVHAYCTTTPGCVGGLNMQNVQIFALHSFGPTTAFLGENTTGTRTNLFIFMNQVLADGYFDTDGYVFKHAGNLNAVNSWIVNHSDSPASAWTFDDSEHIQVTGGVAYADATTRANFSILNASKSIVISGANINTANLATTPAFYFSGGQSTGLFLAGNQVENTVLTNDNAKYLGATDVAQVVSKLQGLFTSAGGVNDWILQNIDPGVVTGRKYLRVDSAGTLQIINDAHNAVLFGIKDNGVVVPVSGANGLSSTLSCSSGQAIKTLTVSGGIVTAATCGAP